MYEYQTFNSRMSKLKAYVSGYENKTFLFGGKNIFLKKFMMGRKQLGAFYMKNLPKIVRYFLSRAHS